MRFQFISDIHLELLNKPQIKRITQMIQKRAEIMVLAGDIGNPFHPNYFEFLQLMSDKFTKIFLIAGNHEYYKNKIQPTKQKITQLFPNISFLDNSTEIYENYNWIGTTQWSHISNINYEINDTTMIPKMTIPLYNSLHVESKLFLQESLNASINKSIVITHHLPFTQLIDDNYKTYPMSNYSRRFR